MATEANGSPEPAPAPIPAPDPALAPAPSSSTKSAKSSRGGGKRRAEKARSGDGGDAVNSAPPPPPLLPPPSSPASGSPTAEGSKDVPTPTPSPSKLGEKAQDNAVTARLMKTKMCYFFEQGKCVSDRCRYAHSVSELRDQPNLHKTKLCKAWAADGTCADGESCGFAHAEAELRVTDGIYKTQMCHFFERGRCLKGDRCTHAHGSTDLRAPKTLPPSDDVTGAPGLVASTVADRRAPMSPLPLSELLADSTSSRQPQQQQPSPVVAMAAASLAAAASAASTSSAMSLFPPSDMGALSYGVPPLPASPWSMPPWSPSGPYGTPDATFDSMQPWASPGGVAALLEPYNAGQPWGCSGGIIDAYGWGADASLEHHRPEFNNAVVPCDLTARLASLDSAVAGLKNEVKNVTGGNANATPQKHIHKI